jgi:hypothetical protein
LKGKIMKVYVVCDYVAEDNSVAYDRHVFQSEAEALAAVKDFDHRTAKGMNPVEKWDTIADGPVVAPCSVITH